MSFTGRLGGRSTHASVWTNRSFTHAEALVPRTSSDNTILAAAVRGIGRHGPMKLTLAGVAREAGLSPALLVRRFGSKHRLLVAVVAHAVEATAAVFAAARESGADPLTALTDALVGLAEPIRGREELANHMAFVQLGLLDPELREHAQAQAHTVRREIAALLAAAADVGHLRPATDTEALARAVQVAYHGSLITWALTGDGPPDAALRADVERVLTPHRTQEAPTW